MSIMDSHAYIPNLTNYQLIDNLVYSYPLSCYPILFYTMKPYYSIHKYLACIFKDRHNIIIMLKISNT